MDLDAASSANHPVLPKARSLLGSLVGYGLPILACIAAIVAAFLISREKEHTQWAFGIAVVVAITTLLAAISQHLRERETSHLTERLRKMAEENVRLIKALRGEFTGGDSFAMAYFPIKDGKHWFTLRHFGNETLRDIRIDVARFDPHQLLDTFVYPSLLPRAIEMVKPFEFKVDNIALQVSFHAPNGWWAETVKCVMTEGELVFALQAWRLNWIDGISEPIILHEDVHPRFPRQPNGTVDFSLYKLDAADVLSKLVRSTETADDSLLRSLGMR